jgi:hypothetical protein
MTPLKKELRERTLGYILTALGLVAGLAWNDAIKALIEYVIPLGNGTLLLKFIYAIVVTIAIVIAIVNLSRFIEKEK